MSLKPKKRRRKKKTTRFDGQTKNQFLNEELKKGRIHSDTASSLMFRYDISMGEAQDILQKFALKKDFKPVVTYGAQNRPTGVKCKHCGSELLTTTSYKDVVCPNHGFFDVYEIGIVPVKEIPRKEPKITVTDNVGSKYGTDATVRAKIGREQIVKALRYSNIDSADVLIRYDERYENAVRFAVKVDSSKFEDVIETANLVGMKEEEVGQDHIEFILEV